MTLKSITIIQFFILLITILFSGCITNDSQYITYKDIIYQDLPDVDSNLISLDLYVPKIGNYSINDIFRNHKSKNIAEDYVNKFEVEKYDISSPMPVMIWVHGGGWRGGNKDNSMVYKIPFFINEGWIFISVNYRLSPAEIPDDPADFDPDRIMYPVHNQDVATAIAWVHDHIDEYGGNPDQISIMGHSAGAGIVAAIGANQSFLLDHGLDLSVLKHVVCLDTGGYDVREQIEKGSNSHAMMYMNSFGTDPLVWDAASPINNIEQNESLPAFFVVTRGSEERINLSQRFINTIKTTGARTQLITALEYTHEEVNGAIGYPQDQIITPYLRYFLGFDFQVDDILIGDELLTYMDPEFLNNENLMTFEDKSTRDVWVAKLNPLTGLPFSETGYDLLIDEDHAPWADALNGPEWCLDKHGPAVAFTKEDNQGIPQLVIARIGSSGVEEKWMVTSDTQRSISPFGTISPTDESIKLAYGYGGTGYADYHVRLLDLANPNQIYDIPNYWTESSAPRWIHDTTCIVYPVVTCQQPIKTEIAKFDIATGQDEILTNDGGEKNEVWGFYAPEFNNEILYAVQLNWTEIAIYRDLKNSDGFLTKIDTLYLPATSPHTFIRSMEPISNLYGIGNVSYFTVLAAYTNQTFNMTDTAIWVLGWGNDPNHRFARRVDEGVLSEKEEYRYEPESYIGAHEVFVYYNTIVKRPLSSDIYQLHRCRTGIIVK